MIDGEVFRRLSDEGYIINVARGPIADTDDLRAALEAVDVAGAGLTSFPRNHPHRTTCCAITPLSSHRHTLRGTRRRRTSNAARPRPKTSDVRRRGNHSRTS